MSLRQSMSGLHTWAGLLVSWILFVVLFSGTVAVFDKELTRWMIPQLHKLEEVSVGADQIRELLVERAPKAHGYWMHPPSERMPYWTAGWEPADFSPFQSFLVDAQSGEVLPRTVGGNFFLELHYELHGGILGLYVVGVAGVFMLVALVSGVIVHRRIFKDFFTLRPKAAKQRAWLDAHNVLGVLGLPFHLLMAYTGLAIFITFYMTAGIKVAYKNDMEHFFHDVQGAFEREALGKPAKATKSIDNMILKAREAWGDDSPVGWINIENPGDAAAMVQIRKAVDKSMVNDQRTVSFDSGSGALIHLQKPYKPGYRTYAWLTGLHMAQFGNELLRVMYFALGLVGCVMVFGGLQVWVSKRETRGHRGVTLVRMLNGAVCGGLPIASLGLLAASRLLPADLLQRTRWEATAFVVIWLLALAHALLRRGSRAMAREQFIALTALALLLPVLSLFGPEPGRVITHFANGDWMMVGIDLGLLLIGGLCAFLGWRLGQERAEPARARRARNEEYA